MGVINMDNSLVKCPLEMLVEKLERKAQRDKLKKEKARKVRRASEER